MIKNGNGIEKKISAHFILVQIWLKMAIFELLG